MRQFLDTLDDEHTIRNTEEYLGAFTESLKLILQQNPVERMGHAVLLAAKTALRLKAAVPGLKEHEIANRLQAIARNIRLMTILNDLTPEEKNILQMHPRNQSSPQSRSAKKSPARRARVSVKKEKPRPRG